MAESIITDWTIVILGRWNIAIFNPNWLKNNDIFVDPTVQIEIPMEPWLPKRVTGDQIVLIPSENRLVISLIELDDNILNRMENVSVKLLSLLSHTPIVRTGMNFGFKSTISSTWISEHLPNTLTDRISGASLTPKGRSYDWKFKHNETDDLNVSCSISGNWPDPRKLYHCELESIR